MFYLNLIKDQPGSSNEAAEFKASRGWFEKFKRRTGILSVVRHGEAQSSDAKAAEEFKSQMNSEQYVPKQVFNFYEIGQFWKKNAEEDFHHTK